MSTLLQDIRYGLRMLCKSPGFTAVAVLTLAVGIGANTAIFSIADASLHKGPDWYRLGAVVGDEPHRTERIFRFSIAEFVDLSALHDIFEHTGALQWSNSALTSGTYPERVGCAHITSGVLSSSDLHLGRNFLPREDHPGSSPVAILSYEFWQSHLSGDPQILGKQVKLDEVQYTIVGVTEPYRSPFASGVMVSMKPNLSDPDRSQRNLWVLVTLQPGVTWKQVETRLNVLARQMARDNRIAHPEYADLHLHFWSVYDAVTSGTRAALLIALSAAAILLLIVCANVAGLLIARATTRQREIAIRLALGAGRFRIVRQMLTETLLLTAAGALAGILAAYWCLPSIVHLIPAQWLAVDPALMRVNARVLLFAVSAALLTGIFFGVAPAWLSSRPEPLSALNAGGQRMAGSRHSRISRDALVTCEIALALIVLVSSAWMLETYRNLQHIDLGFEPAHVLSMSISLPTSRYSSADKIGSFFEEALARVESLPGVQGAALLSGLPMLDRRVDVTTRDFTIEGQPAQNGSELDNADFRVISPTYFDLIGAHLLQGRFFTRNDRGGTPPVAIINETMARQFWPGANPIGQRIHVSASQATDRANTVTPQQTNPVITIVGVVSDVKQINVIDVPVRQEFYLPELQNAAFSPGLTMIVRSPLEAGTLVPAIRSAIRSLDPELPVFGVEPMTQVVSDSYGPKRIVTVLLSFFAVAALLLSVVGIYSVIAYSVSQRSHEIGVRLALGAHPRDIQRLIIKQGVRLALMGLGIGAVAALFVARLLAHSVSGVSRVSLLYKVSPWNPLPILVVGSVIVVASLAACWIPARRAMRVDPMVALRYE